MRTHSIKDEARINRERELRAGHIACFRCGASTHLGKPHHPGCVYSPTKKKGTTMGVPMQSNPTAHKPTEKVPCRFCKTPTLMLGTRECDGCHAASVQTRTMAPAVLARILLDGMPLQSRKELVAILVGEALKERNAAAGKKP